MSELVYVYARANPPTRGHEKLIQKAVNLAEERGADLKIFFTHTQGKKNPLTFNQKVAYMLQAFPEYAGNIQRIPYQFFDVQKVYIDYKKFTLVCGSDRYEHFHNILNEYNGKEFPLREVEVVVAGERDLEGELSESISATLMREYALAGEYKQFKEGLPTTLEPIATDIYNDVRTALLSG